MARILAITNQKGGVGKTTTAINLAASLARTRRRVLLVDLDPQGNATVGSGVARDTLAHNVYDILVGDTPLADAIVAARSGYDIVGSSPDLAGALVELISRSGREHRLREVLAPAVERYDFVLIDCPPSLDLLTVNALVAADAVLIPVQCEYYALEGLSALLDTVNRVRERLNPRLAVEGLVRTMFDGRNTLANEVSDQLRQHFGGKLYDTVVPRNVRLAEAPSHGQPVIDYDPRCIGSQAYLAIAGELLRRNESHSHEESETRPGT